MDAISAFVISSPTASSLNPDRAFVNGIENQLKCCHLLLEGFLKGRQTHADLLAEIKWITDRGGDACKLEQRLRGYLEAFRSYLLAISLEFNNQSAAKTEGRLDNVDRSLTEILTLVQIRSKQPKYLGYPWQGDSSGNSSFQDTLEIAFRSHPGQQKVRDGDYELVNASKGTLVSLGLPQRTPQEFANADTSYLLNLSEAHEWQRKVVPASDLQ
ncbi:MAG: hypothetical protein M1839_004486 [Geoglossum umbratile]|nr:MAG: hypothetical protein M1839_004486 [Geoglossum umbratile]